MGWDGMKTALSLRHPVLHTCEWRHAMSEDATYFIRLLTTALCNPRSHHLLPLPSAYPARRSMALSPAEVVAAAAMVAVGQMRMRREAKGRSASSVCRSHGTPPCFRVDTW